MSTVTRDQALVHLPTRASELRAQAAAVIDDARAEAAQLQALAQGEAEKLLAAADVLDRLASGNQSTIVRARAQGASVRAMNSAHKLAISAAHAKSRLASVVQAAGFSLNDFSRLPTIKSAPSTLRSGHAGTRPIDEAVCIRVQHALGKDENGNWRFPATLENWPRMERTKAR